ncbi:TRAP transporter large permease [Teichococcus vastitatis]|uniref:TRAP transporter large permease protein n=1 Tax=Teichococcus vastitatis TaxID=2307076 RepID=A0ABS9WAU0_9PROT|nr:TRAP transporter large permease [Pseudoroseomonas vastitatis]MCI0756113.1 TRAP transporter large permease [Pseudoroseomonas vastitatis]
MLIASILIALCVFILFGVPIGVALGSVAIGIMWVTAGTDLFVIMIQRIYAGTTSFPLLAIPFFILSGNLMNTGGMTERIFAVAHMIVGRIRGGLGHVNVLASMLFAGMSGSAVADAAGLGLVEIKAMRQAGYTPRFAATLTAVSSTIGPVIPPSIPFVIYGSLANVSVGALFLAGIVPGVLMGISLMVIVAIVAKRQNLPMGEARPPVRIALRILGDALPALAMPPLILGGIFGGIVTPTEAAVVAAGYAFLLGKFFYRVLSFAELPSILWESGRQTAQVMFIIAASAPFAWVLIQQEIPNAVIANLFNLSREPWVVLLIVNVVLFVLGMFIEGVAIIIIAFPVLLPVMMQIGVDPVHFGVIMVLNIMIGLVTPPVGLCLYVVSEVSKVPIGEIAAEMWPYVVALIAVLMVVTYVPALSLWLPHALGYGLVR